MIDEPLAFNAVEECRPSDDWLPKDFKYPDGFFEYITFDEAEFDINGVVSTISFLTKREVVQWESFLRKAHYHDLIPFGRNDDDLFCFDKKVSNEIYLVDLSEKPIQEHELPQFKNFYEFINAIRAANDLKPWLKK